MRALKTSLAACLLACLHVATAFGQTATELDSPAVLRVADQFRCTCGCNLTMSCKMEGGCHICKGAKAQIFAMQSAGKSDSQIVDAFVQENGKDVLAIRPGPMGVIGPWAMLGLGAILVIFLIRRFAVAKAVPATTGPAIGSAELDRYHAQIEKDLEKLE
jgi:cytochrome c-type biogenesis protein CcmH/NrfF